MAVIARGKTRCSLCERVLSEGEDIVATSHFIGDPYDRLWRYSDTGMHRACFLTWSDRTAFIARYNSIVGRKVWGDGMSDRMEEDGRITRHPANRQPAKPPEAISDGNAATERYPAADRVARRIPLSERRPHVYVGFIEPRELLLSGSLVIAANAEMPREALRDRLLASIKVGPIERMAVLLKEDGPGIALSPLSMVPPGLACEADAALLALDKCSPHHEALATSAIVIFAGGDWPVLRIELFAVPSEHLSR